jgi:hypothetical protein
MIKLTVVPKNAYLGPKQTNNKTLFTNLRARLKKNHFFGA